MGGSNHQEQVQNITKKIEKIKNTITENINIILRNIIHRVLVKYIIQNQAKLGCNKNNLHISTCKNLDNVNLIINEVLTQDCINKVISMIKNDSNIANDFLIAVENEFTREFSNKNINNSPSQIEVKNENNLNLNEQIEFYKLLEKINPKNGMSEIIANISKHLGDNTIKILTPISGVSISNNDIQTAVSKLLSLLEKGLLDGKYHIKINKDIKNCNLITTTSKPIIIDTIGVIYSPI